jgi:hypothetical protein
MKREHLFIVASLTLCLFGSTSAAATPVGTLNLPENISVELILPEQGTLMFSGITGPVQLPQDDYRLESWTLEKKDESGHSWKLSGDVNTARMIEIGSEPTTLEIQTEPIVCDLQIYPGPQAMNFTLGLKGPTGERLRVSGDAPGVKRDQLPQPTFVLYNADRSFEKSYDFKSQCCGNYQFNWTPPAELEGPFFVDIKVAGPFKLDFEPINISEAHQAKITEQQVAHKKMTQQIYLVGLCYVVILAVIAGVLIKSRKSIAAAMQKSDGAITIKRLLIVLGIFLLLILLDPLIFLVSGEESIGQVLSQSLSIVVLLLMGAAWVWAVRKVRTKWPFVTIMLYGIFFVLLLIPIVFMVFAMFGRPDTSITDIGLEDCGEFYVELFTIAEPQVLIAWAITLALIAAQACLLIVPVRLRHQRPKQRRGIWFTAIIAALLYTVLLFAAGLSIMAAAWGDDISEPVFWILVGILPLNWIGWSVAFCLFSRSMEPECFIRRLMRWLIGGSILELLIAVPSHIIVRHRDVCCAHGLTTAGLTTGIAVIFFAFGPGLYFLYADRIRSKRADLPEQAGEPTPETQQ